MVRNLFSPKLSRSFTLARLVHSDTARTEGIDNTPPPDVIENLRVLASGLDEVQRLLGHPLRISSGYRSPALNEFVGGTAGSQHCLGLAADFTCPKFGAPMAVARAIAESNVHFDQCILEFGRWVHLSFNSTPRRRVLTIYSAAAGYIEGLIDEDGRLLGLARRPTRRFMGQVDTRIYASCLPRLCAVAKVTCCVSTCRRLHR